MSALGNTVHAAVLSYASGIISANDAAFLLGNGATVHDVIQQLKAAGLPPPRISREDELAEVARAQEVLGPVRSV